MYLIPRGPVPPQRTDLWAWQPRRRASTDWGVCACAGRETRWGPPIRVRSGDGRWQAQPPLSKRTAGARRCLPDASPRPPCLVVGGNNRDRFIFAPTGTPLNNPSLPPPPPPPLPYRVASSLRRIHSSWGPERARATCGQPLHAHWNPAVGGGGLPARQAELRAVGVAGQG